MKARSGPAGDCTGTFKTPAFETVGSYDGWRRSQHITLTKHATRGWGTSRQNISKILFESLTLHLHTGECSITLGGLPKVLPRFTHPKEAP
ncbi:uncharacterized protein G2W53_007163 [Senna tora]|uniref:Uncharacterized protein n=1 Tax=Senna tora TaxID=362788 RepID=A0A835CEP6_9FABA|nr:uncharacterized protein G2W53_007163 [Senna tora]